MPVESIEAGLDAVVSWVKASPAETAAAKSHRASIEAVLKSSFGMTNFFRTGSFGNGTSVSGYSDVDYFAVIPNANLKANSASTLTAVAEALRQRFPNTGVRVDGPAVKVPFGKDGSETTEVVPVDATGTTSSGYRKFDMPDGNGGWMFSAPESHDAYVTETDKKLSYKLKPLIRLAKRWKFGRSVQIKSFYLEMWITQYAQSESAIVYRIDLERIFRRLADADLPAIVDPRFPNSGRLLQPVNTSIQRVDAVSALKQAAEWAEQSAVHVNSGNESKAFPYWDKIFYGYFPAYG